MLTYLERLTARVASGISLLPKETRDRHANYLLNAQRDDGGFAGRQGESDLYYTGFGLRGLAVLGRLQGETAQRAAVFLRRRLEGRESIVDFFSLIYSAALLETLADINIFQDGNTQWRAAVAKTLENLRRDDGGYAKGPEGRASSTYHTFLVALCLELIESEIPKPDQAIQFIRSQRADEGGFREIRASKRAGTNPTAAAIGILRILDAMDETTREESIDFLVEMQTDEGGLRANTRIPIADILSTFTGLVTLVDLGAADEIDLSAVLGFVQSMERDEGGFHAAAWDEAHDVEYTFYGLGTLGLLEMDDSWRTS